MQAVDQANPGLVVLTATLRNRATIELGYPPLDLVLTNSREHTIARRTFLPAEYLAAGENPRGSVAPGAKIAILLNLDTGDLGATGFKLNLVSAAVSETQIELWQISPDKVKLVKAGAVPPAANREKPPLSTVCVEWGTFSADDAARAATALAKLDLGNKLSRRDIGETYWVNIPPQISRADVEKKADEVRKLGIADFYVVQDTGPMQFAISLGVFKTEEAANNHLAQLWIKGLRSATTASYGAATTTFVISEPGDTTTLKLAELKPEFPAATLRAVACDKPNTKGQNGKANPASSATESEKKIANTYVNGVAQEGGCTFTKDGAQVASGNVAGVEGKAIVAIYSTQECGGGNNWQTKLVVLSTRSGKAEKIAEESAAGMSELKIVNGKISAKVLTWGPSDAHCCPKSEGTALFSVQGNKLASSPALVR
jgi:hypothetical protein